MSQSTIPEGDIAEAGYLFLDLLRCAMVADREMLEKYLTGPVNVHPWKFPRGALDDLVNMAICTSRDMAGFRAGQERVRERVSVLECRVREMQLSLDNLTPGVGEP